MRQALAMSVQVPESNSGADRLFFQGVSPSMQAVEEIIRELAQSQVPVLLLAEAGAGKKTIARRIHQATTGKRPESFREISCMNLTSKELSAAISEAEGAEGTLFLEEVGALTAECQGQLFQLLPTVENNGNRAHKARLICGSARELEAEVRLGRFREDLYYRISGVCLRVPPLRQRREDIASLARFFTTRFAQEFHRIPPALSDETQQLMQDYAWPGNVRELKNVTRAIVALGDESVAMGGLRALLTRANSGNGERVSLKQASRAASREAEKELILKVLTRTRWNRRRAAQELQISYKALLYKLKQIGYGECGVS